MNRDRKSARSTTAEEAFEHGDEETMYLLLWEEAVGRGMAAGHSRFEAEDAATDAVLATFGGATKASPVNYYRFVAPKRGLTTAKKARSGHVTLDSDEPAAEVAKAVADPSAEQGFEGVERDVSRAGGLGSLNPGDVAIVADWVDLERDYQVLASKLPCTQVAARQRVSRARARLRRQLVLSLPEPERALAELWLNLKCDYAELGRSLGVSESEARVKVRNTRQSMLHPD